MSQSCLLPECVRPTLDGQDWCGKDYGRISLFTRERLKTASTVKGWDAAFTQAVAEIRRPLAVSDLTGSTK